MTHPLAIGLGANLGSEEEILERFRGVKVTLESALEAELRASPVYRSAPLGPVADQPAFLNAVLVGSDPELDPVVLLAALLELESALGRDRTQGIEQGPRVIDLDLLIAGEATVAMDGPTELIVPHPRMVQRAFVLAPLADLVGGDYRLPELPLSLADLLAKVAGQELIRTELNL